MVISNTYPMLCYIAIYQHLFLKISSFHQYTTIIVSLLHNVLL